VRDRPVLPKHEGVPGAMATGVLGIGHLAMPDVIETRLCSVPFLLNAEELLRELVDEHKDTLFEYRSPMGVMRSAMWVGGGEPIEDLKTKARFKTLMLWCQQVS
jgi:hypothetical protein